MSVILRGCRGRDGWPVVTRTIVDAPEDPLFTTAEAKQHLRIDTTDEDSLVDDWVAAATQKVQTDTDQLLRSYVIDLGYDRFPSAAVLDLPIAPVTAILSIKYTDTAGIQQTFDGSSYILSGQRIGLIDTAVWPTDLRSFAPIVIQVQAGYDESLLVPADLLHAVRLVIGWMSEHREPTDFEQTLYENWISGYCAVKVA